MESSPGCWAAFGEVLAREYSNPELFEVHRLTVDAYAVQHPGQPSRQSIHSVGLHLLRLILQLEQRLSAEDANAAMLALGRYKGDFYWLTPPHSRGSVTVADIRGCTDVAAHKQAVQAWAASALEAWAVHRHTIARC